MNIVIVVIVVILAALGAFYYKFVYKMQKTIAFYKSQGVTIVPGADRPVVGNLADGKEHANECKNSEDALPTFFKWLHNTKLDPEVKNHIKYEKHRALLHNIMGRPILSINDAKMA